MRTLHCFTDLLCECMFTFFVFQFVEGNQNIWRKTKNHWSINKCQLKQQRNIILNLLNWQKLENQLMSNVGKDVETQKLSGIAGERL